jgi:hypothetical protein
MNSKTFKKYVGRLSLVIVMAAGLAAPVFGQETLSEKAILEMVEKSLPGWEESILNVRQRRGWVEQVSFVDIYEVMDDRPPEVEKLPGDADRLGDKERMVSLDKDRGRVRYVNRARGWDFKADADSKAVEKDKALELVVDAVRKLGISPRDFGESRVDTQVGGGAPVGETVIKDRYEMYRIVSIPRMIGEFPVYGSMVRGAVSNRGQIQRFLVEWPTFRMPKGLALKSREEVAREVAKEIREQDPYGDVSVKSKLVYAEFSQDDESPPFVPAVVVSVSSKPTPYQVVVPVAKVASKY